MTEVVAALIWDGDRFLACQRPAHKDRGLLWEFVGGKVEPGETKAHALVRECREELGITVAVGEIFMEVTHTYPDLTIHLTLFHAAIAEGTPRLLEHNDMRWVTIEEMDALPFCPADTVILDRLRDYDRAGDILKETLFQILRDHGAALMGAGDLTGVPGAEGYPVGVSVAVPIPRSIVEDLKIAPTREYLALYHALNRKLDAIIASGADFLVRQGYRALANTTETIRQNDAWATPLPHKTVATRAGLGWIGKSALLVTKAYGGAVRLSSLLTDAPLPTAAPVNESKCGKCSKCVDACPAQALTGTLWSVSTPRDALFRRTDCYETQLFLMRTHTGIETDLCGRCFAVCPHTQRYLRTDK